MRKINIGINRLLTLSFFYNTSILIPNNKNTLKILNYKLVFSNVIKIELTVYFK